MIKTVTTSTNNSWVILPRPTEPGIRTYIVCAPNRSLCVTPDPDVSDLWVHLPLGELAKIKQESIEIDGQLKTKINIEIQL